MAQWPSLITLQGLHGVPICLTVDRDTASQQSLLLCVKLEFHENSAMIGQAMYDFCSGNEVRAICQKQVEDMLRFSPGWSLDHLFEAQVLNGVHENMMKAGVASSIFDSL